VHIDILTIDRMEKDELLATLKVLTQFLNDSGLSRSAAAAASIEVAEVSDDPMAHSGDIKMTVSIFLDSYAQVRLFATRFDELLWSVTDGGLG
jgi:hypothetical protein